MFPVITVSIEGSQSNLSGFQYWWLKSVRDYRLDVHCARCLVGPYDRRINKAMPLNQPVELHGDLVCLCGGAAGQRWVHHFHAAAKLEVGTQFSVPTYNGLTVHFHNAQMIPIEPLPESWNGLNKAFTTCRNYQFAVQMSRRQTNSSSSSV
jgi:hypothetical protein